MFKARVYFYLGSSVESVRDPAALPGAPPTMPAAPRDSSIGLSESEIMNFIHDKQHRCEVILTPEKTDESALAVIETKHPRQTVRLKSVTWLC